MKTLTLLQTQKNETLELEVRTDRICSFCGEASEVCGKTVEGAYKVKTMTQKTERDCAYVVHPHKDTTFEEIPTGIQKVSPLFGENYKKITETRFAHVLKNDIPFKVILIPTGELEKHTYTADICIQCIRQLAKLTKDMKAK